MVAHVAHNVTSNPELGSVWRAVSPPRRIEAAPAREADAPKSKAHDACSLAQAAGQLSSFHHATITHQMVEAQDCMILCPFFPPHMST